MTDVHDKQTRSRNMAAIRSKDTMPEIMLRSGLHRAGLRFRIKSKLPGKPDLVLRRFNAVIFVHGCFWHVHGCPRSRQPGGENADYWTKKLARNVERDAEVAQALSDLGWRQLTVWECALVGKGKLELGAVVERVREWLEAGQATGVIEGRFS